MNDNVKNYCGFFKIQFLSDNEIVYKIINVDIDKSAPIIKEVISHEVNEVFEYNKELCKVIEKDIHNVNLDKLVKDLDKHIKYGFIHMTSYNNLKNIYKTNFLYSHNKIVSEKIQTDVICNTEIVNNTEGIYNDCVRFYLRDHAPALYKMVINNTSLKDNLCILICDSSIIDSALSEFCYLSPYFSSKGKNYKSVLDGKILDYLNYDYIFSAVDYLNDEYFNVETKPYRNAEFLFKGDLPLKYIKKIIFNNILTKNKFIKEFNTWNIECIVDPSMF